MCDWLKNVKGSDVLTGLGALAGGIGNAYAAKQQAKAAERTYNLNADLLREERARKKQAQAALNSAWDASLWNATRPAPAI